LDPRRTTSLWLKYRVEDRWQLSCKFPKVEKFIFGRPLKDEIRISKKQAQTSSSWLEKVDELMKA
jgi:hypothetical protein